MPFAFPVEKTGSFLSFADALVAFYRKVQQRRLERQAILVYGEDDFLISRIIARLREHLTESSDDGGEVQTLDGEATGPDDVLALVFASAGGLFQTGSRLFILHWSPFPLTKEKEAKKWGEAVRSLPSQTFLVIGSSPLPSKIEKVLSDYLLLLPVVSPKRDRDLVEMTKMLARQEGVRITDEAAQELVARIGPDSRSLAMELERLILLSDQKGPITADLVAESVPSLRADIFRLMDAVSEGRRGDAITLLNELLVRRESPIAILYMLARQWRLTLQARLILDKGFLSEADIDADEALFRQAVARIPADWQDRLPKDPRYNLLKQSSWVVRRFFKHALRMTTEDLIGGMQLILEADADFKRVTDPGDVLFLLISQLTKMPAHTEKRG
ncbi:MAG: DNA polymerase III subunit delta [Armatimonadetes bacterium]|nr:DNA polymerase III subunit delta [Armatimonadota bacterium]MDW8121791.1 DNA polymerase III subunit delta [Armatimonadota bacterium]